MLAITKYNKVRMFILVLDLGCGHSIGFVIARQTPGLENDKLLPSLSLLLNLFSLCFFVPYHFKKMAG